MRNVVLEHHFCPRYMYSLKLQVWSQAKFFPETSLKAVPSVVKNLYSPVLHGFYRKRKSHRLRFGTVLMFKEGYNIPSPFFFCLLLLLLLLLFLTTEEKKMVRIDFCLKLSWLLVLFSSLLSVTVVFSLSFLFFWHSFPRVQSRPEWSHCICTELCEWPPN